MLWLDAVALDEMRVGRGETFCPYVRMKRVEVEYKSCRILEQKTKEESMGILADQIEKDRVENELKIRLIRLIVTGGWLRGNAMGLPAPIAAALTVADVNQVFKDREWVHEAAIRVLEEMEESGFPKKLDMFIRMDRKCKTPADEHDVECLASKIFTKAFCETGKAPSDEWVIEQWKVKNPGLEVPELNREG